MTDLAATLADLALDTARAAADLIRDRADQGVSVADTKTSDSDVVTEADRAAETMIRDRIRAARPDDAFLGEEAEAEPGTSGVRWIIDPIDGTVNFLYGLPQYAVSIAAELDGEVVAGVVIDVAKRAEYVARPGPDGVVALRDGAPIAVRGPAPLSQRLIATGFAYRAEVRAVQAAAVARLIPHDSRHPAARVVRPGPLSRGRGAARRLPGGGRQPLGPRRRRADREGRRCPHSRADRSVRNDPLRLWSGSRFRRAPGSRRKGRFYPGIDRFGGPLPGLTVGPPL